MLHAGKPIIGGLNVNKRSPALNPNVVFDERSAFDSFYEELVNVAMKRSSAGVLQVDAVDMSFTLIEREVIDALVVGAGPERRWFWRGDGIGENEWELFCRRAFEKGYASFVDTGAIVKHVGVKTLDIRDWDPTSQQTVKVSRHT